MRLTSRSSSSCSFAPAVVQFHGDQRLDVKGGAAGRLVVHHATELPAEVGLDRQDVATVALGDDGLLQRWPVAGRGHHLVAVVEQTFVRQANGDAQPP